MPQIKKIPTKSHEKKQVQLTSANPIERIRGIGFESHHGIKCNIYGQSGTGKTTLWATFPKPILCILASGGKGCGELRSIDTEEYRKTIQSVSVIETGDVKEIVDYQNQTDHYSTIVLDHVTGLQDLVLKNILGLDELPPQSSWGMATQQNWGQCALQMKEILRALLGLECNVVIIGQERAFNVEEGAAEFLKPNVASALSPSIVGWLNPAVDYIVQTFKRKRMIEQEVKVGGKTTRVKVAGKGVDYCLRVGPDEVYTTKFRKPRSDRDMIDVIVDPSYEKIMKLIKG